MSHHQIAFALMKISKNRLGSMTAVLASFAVQRVIGYFGLISPRFYAISNSIYATFKLFRDVKQSYAS